MLEVIPISFLHKTFRIHSREWQGRTKFIIWIETYPDNTGHIVSDRKIMAILSQTGNYWPWILPFQKLIW